jgi:hypothetical protein
LGLKDYYTKGSFLPGLTKRNGSDTKRTVGFAAKLAKGYGCFVLLHAFFFRFWDENEACNPAR